VAPPTNLWTYRPVPDIKVENILKDSLDSIPSPSLSVKNSNYGSIMFAVGAMAKHCWALSTNF
jgi:hypothetical protein